MKEMLIKIWEIFDFIYQHITRLEYVDKRNGNIFRIVFCRYSGLTLVTPDGIKINNGDYIIKLHICNWKLSKILKGINNDTKMAFTTLRLVKKSLPGLVEYIENHPKGKQVNVIIGTTLLHRGVRRFGFNVATVPNKIRYKIKNNYLKFMLVIMHPDGLKRLNLRTEELVIKRVYISKKELINRYSSNQGKKE